MGNATATNTVQSVIDTSISVSNQYTLDCSTKDISTQTFDFNGCKNVDISHITSGSYFYVNRQCLQDTNTQNQINADISQAISQAAQAITQNLGLPSSSDAQNVVNQAMNLGVAVTNVYAQDCSLVSDQQQTFKCTNSQNIVITDVGESSTLTSIQKCTSNNSTLDSVKATLHSTISQTAVAKQENVLSGLITIILIVLMLFLVVPIVF